MNVPTEIPDRTQNLFREACVLISEFLVTVDTALESDHPSLERIETWSARYEGRRTASGTG